MSTLKLVPMAISFVLNDTEPNLITDVSIIGTVDLLNALQDCSTQLLSVFGALLRRRSILAIFRLLGFAL